MDVHDKLDELSAVVENARALPMSASCIVNRAEALALLDEVRELLPEEFAHAELLLRDREAVIDEGRREAERVVAEARARQDSLVADAEVVREAHRWAGDLHEQALREATDIRVTADEYADRRLAHCEVALHKALTAVQQGREAFGEHQGVAEHLGPAAAPASEAREG
ncbi:MAG: hypothetical protein ACRDPK_11625 [Carbonactinosporaceae bacterium]